MKMQWQRHYTGIDTLDLQHWKFKNGAWCPFKEINKHWLGITNTSGKQHLEEPPK